MAGRKRAVTSFHSAGTTSSSYSGSAVYGSIVHADHLLTLLAVALVDGLLHECHCLLVRDDACNPEECGLQDSIGPVAQTYLLSDLCRVDDVYLEVLLCYNLLYMVRNPLDGLLHRPETVEQESSVLLDTLEHVIFI